jgi:hypothetical protein
MSPPNAQRPGAASPVARLTHQTASTATRPQFTRLAEDAHTQLAELDRWIDASDVMLMAALDGSDAFTLTQAAEHALTAHTRIRRLLALAVAA